MNRLTRVLWLVRLAIALDAILYSGLIPLLPQLGETARVDDGTLGLLLGIFPLAGVLGCIPCGILSDRYNPGPLLAIGMGVLAAGAAAIALWPLPLMIGLARFAQGLAGAMVWTAGFALVHQIAGADRQSSEIGLSYSASSVGELTGPMLSGFMAERATVGAFFWLSGLLAAGGAALMAMFRMPHLEASHHRQGMQIDRRGQMALLAGGSLMGVVYNAIYGGLLVIAPLVLAREYRFTAFMIGQVFLAWHVVLIASQIGGGQWGDRAPRTIPIFAGTLVMVAGLLVMAMGGSLPVTLAGMALAGAGCGIAGTVAAPIFSDAWTHVRPQGAGVGLGFGVMLTISTVGFTLGNTLGGALLELTSPASVLAWSAGVGLLTGVSGLMLGKYLVATPVIAPVD